jgi:hypothetical protein
MQELQSLLTKCETAITVNFNHLNHRVWCYAHIINICSSHIIASVTSTSRSNLRLPIDLNYTTCDDSDDELDDSDIDLNHEFNELELANIYDKGDSKLKEWSVGIKRDPLRHAQRVVHIL